MTLGYEAARRRVARVRRRAARTRSSSPAARPRRSISSPTSWPATRRRVLLSAARASFEHRAVAAAPGWQDRCLPADRRWPDRSRRRRGDADARAQDGRLRACLQRARLACSMRARAADLAHRVGAKLLLDGCQAVPRLPVDVAALDCDFYVFSAPQALRPDRDRRAVGAGPNCSTRCRRGRAAAR